MKEQSHRLFGLILAGGNGTRLWPLSREEYPKQFLTLGGTMSLFQEAARRLAVNLRVNALHVLAAERIGDLVQRQLRQIGLLEPESLIIEPVARSTAPAMALGIAHLVARGASPDDLVLCCPSDQRIADTEAFCRAVRIAVKCASEGHLVTFGIAPRTPETGFGYIETEPIPGQEWQHVRRFVEKPDLERARDFLAQGNFLWNGGIFCFSIRSMLYALEQFFPEAGIPAREGLVALRRAFSSIPATPIDYAVMEKASNIACVPLDAGWSDVGNWDALGDILPRDSRGNASIGDTLLLGGRNNIIVAPHRLIVGIDLQDTVIVDTPDALLVAPRGSADRLREAVRILQEQGRRELVQTLAPNRIGPENASE